jgi:hypothetical protein
VQTWGADGLPHPQRSKQGRQLESLWSRNKDHLIGRSDNWIGLHYNAAVESANASMNCVPSDLGRFLLFLVFGSFGLALLVPSDLEQSTVTSGTTQRQPASMHPSVSVRHMSAPYDEGHSGACPVGRGAVLVELQPSLRDPQARRRERREDSSWKGLHNEAHRRTDTLRSFTPPLLCVRCLCTVPRIGGSGRATAASHSTWKHVARRKRATAHTAPIRSIECGHFVICPLHSGTLAMHSDLTAQ